MKPIAATYGSTCGLCDCEIFEGDPIVSVCQGSGSDIEGDRMTESLRERGELLGRLPMVKWDRCLRPGDGWLIAYGWIPRDDARSDFVVVEFLWPDEPTACMFTTSSAEHSAEIGRLLLGPSTGHIECERIADIPQLAATTLKAPA